MAREPLTVEQWQTALADYTRAVHTFVEVLERRALDVVCAQLPGAALVVLHGEIGDEGRVIQRIQQVRDVSGALLGDIDDPSEPFDTMTDEADPLFDWLADLSGDDYLGTHEIEVTP